jgi:hypothetical protein
MPTCFGPYSREDIIKNSKEIPKICNEWNSLDSSLQEVYRYDIISLYKVLLTYTCAWNNSDTELKEALRNLLSQDYADLILKHINLDISRPFYD